jgi:hypothetical protein
MSLMVATPCTSLLFAPAVDLVAPGCRGLLLLVACRYEQLRSWRDRWARR